MDSKSRASLPAPVAILGGLSLLSATAAAMVIVADPVTAVSFREPNREPPTTKAGGTRGGLVATLVPPGNRYGVTNQARPTFVVHLSPGAMSGRTATLYLIDIETDERQEATIPLAGRSGIIAFELPGTFQDLAVERPYQWFLALEATGNAKRSTPPKFDGGTIERIPASPESASGLTLSLEAAISASEEGRWYDAVATWAALRQAQPEDLEIGGHWREFLQSVKLGDYVEAPATHLSAQP